MTTKPKVAKYRVRAGASLVEGVDPAEIRQSIAAGAAAHAAKTSVGEVSSPGEVA